jgi:glycosyltransferase involved in cell wall biosynthesis
MKRTPLISIGLPIYNGAQHLRKALDALLAQDYENFELILSDNASTDETRNICLEYAERDARVRYYRNETNLGAVVNFNRVIELAGGEFFMWAADHDDWEREYLSRCLEVLLDDPGVVLCYPEAAWIGLDDELLEPIPIRLDTRGLDKVSRFHVTIWALDNCYVIYGLMRMSALKQTGRYRQSFAPDIILLTELALLGAFACVPERLFYLRRTAGYGDAYTQAEKLNIRVSSPRSASYLYWQLIRDRVRSVNRYFEGVGGKGVATLSIILGMLVKYRWIARAFAAPRPLESQQQAEPPGGPEEGYGKGAATSTLPQS